jgi:hypothetical protein
MIRSLSAALSSNVADTSIQCPSDDEAGVLSEVRDRGVASHRRDSPAKTLPDSQTGSPMTDRPRRSALYMPASNAKAIEKARSLPCDVVILDLEDAVAPDATEPDLDSDTASDAAPDVERSDARRAPRPTSRLNPSSRFDLPAENATMNAPPARGRVRPSGRDVGGAEAR